MHSLKRTAMLPSPLSGAEYYNVEVPAIDNALFFNEPQFSENIVSLANFDRLFTGLMTNKLRWQTPFSCLRHFSCDLSVKAVGI